MKTPNKLVKDMISHNDIDALNFARLHDWGEKATLKNGIIYNLKNTYSTRDGKVYTKTASVPANIHALRKFGGY